MEKVGPVTTRWAHCGEPAALICKGCKTQDPNSGSLVGTTRYCGVPCQKKDWVHHKALCKATKASGETKTSELQRPETQTHEPQPHASHPHESPSNDPQGHGLQAHEPPPYRVHQDHASISEAKQAHQTKKPLAQPDNPHACASCHNPATAACEKCEAAPNSTGGLVETTHYCSPICQTAHWASHKEACLASQARRKLYEAGSALQDAYHGYCQGLVVAMLATKSLNANHMILHEEGPTRHTTNAIALLDSMRTFV